MTGAMADEAATGREIVLLPQNEQHLETVALLLPELRHRGLDVRVILMDGVFHQGLAASALPPGAAVIELPLVAAKPFYRLSPLAQLGLMLRASGPIRAAVGRPRAILAFNDGAMQRLAFRAAPAARTALLIDGMISDYGAPSGLRIRLRGALKRLGRRWRSSRLGLVLPSEVGLSPVDVVFVLGEHSAAVLRRQGSRAGRVLATGLPRWPESVPGTDRPVRRILYLSASFAWHDRHASARAQVIDAATLAAIATKLGMEVRVRVHPRDDRAVWDQSGIPLIDPRSEPLSASIARADLVLAMVSTGLLEAMTMGVPAHPLIIADDPAVYRDAFVADPGLEMITTAAELENRLQKYAVGIPAETRARQSEALGRLVTASGTEASQRVVDALQELLS